MTYYAGLDPDMKNFSFAVIGSGGGQLPFTDVQLYYVKCTKQLPEMQVANFRSCLHSFQALRGAIECPIRKNKQGAKDSDLFKLCRLAGNFEGAYFSEGKGRFEVVSPNDWKGTVPKLIHQKAVFRKLGWRFKEFKTGIVPDLPQGVLRRGFIFNPKTGDYKEDLKLFNQAGTWLDLGDSLGIALWVKETVEKQNRKEKWLGRS